MNGTARLAPGFAPAGRGHGPERPNLVPIVGRARAEARLRGRTA